MPNTAWTALVIAGLFEILWVIGMKHSEGFSKPLPSVVTLILMAISFSLLAYSLKHVPLGTAYAVWVGIGAIGVAIFGIVWLGESGNWLRLLCIALVVAGVVGLKISDGR